MANNLQQELHTNCSKLLQQKMYIWCKYTVQFATCTKNMELIKLINFNVSLQANLEGQGW